MLAITPMPNTENEENIAGDNCTCKTGKNKVYGRDVLLTSNMKKNNNQQFNNTKGSS